jgi:hypothetical protein
VWELLVCLCRSPARELLIHQNTAAVGGIVQTPSKADMWPALWVIGTITSHRAETDRSTPKDRSPQSPTCVPRQSRDPFFLSKSMCRNDGFRASFPSTHAWRLGRVGIPAPPSSCGCKHFLTLTSMEASQSIGVLSSVQPTSMLPAHVVAIFHSRHNGKQSRPRPRPRSRSRAQLGQYHQR